MARKLENLVNVDTPSVDYPRGRVRDESAPAANDGTPVNEALMGDIHQFFAGLLDSAQVTPNGLPDNTTNGFQLLKAFQLHLTKLHGVLDESLTAEYINAPGGGSPKDIVYYNNRFYISTLSPFKVSVYNASTAAEVAAEEFGSGVVTNPTGIAISNGKAYVCDATDNKIYVFNLSDGTAIPAEDIDLSGNTPEGIFIKNDKAYVAVTGPNAGMMVMDIATLAHIPAESIALTNARDIKIIGNRIFISRTTEIKVYKLSDQTLLYTIGAAALTGGGGLDICGDKIYVYNGDSANRSIRVWDALTGTEFVNEKMIITPTSGATGHGVLLHQDKLYVCDLDAGDVKVYKRSLAL